MFATKLLQKKVVSVWGFGYLGYTSALRMQEHGFHIKIFDFSAQRFEAFEKNRYPGIAQKNHWSTRYSIPELNREKITFCTDPGRLFDDDDRMHIIALPMMSMGPVGAGGILENLLKIFVKHQKHLDEALILFQSVGVPGQIDESFYRPLKQANAKCRIAVAFRSDWVLEEFLQDSRTQVIAGNEPDDLEQTRAFFDLVKTPVVSLGSIQEAEIFENAKNALNYATTALINQMALSYPDINFQSIVRLLLQEVDLSTCKLSIGAGGYRMPFSVDALLAGSKLSECLSILKEAEAVNFSTVLCYSEYMARKGFKEVLVLGITNRDNQKDFVAISPSLTLVETMHNKGLKVYVNDPHYSAAELEHLIPYGRPLSLESLPPGLDAIIVMSDHSQYRGLSQEQLDSIIHPKIKLIIDNTGIFSKYHFQHACYHQVGDGKINILK
ncbi:MAG: UDP binding domain-containing protein [Nitrospinales bacterium]